MNFYIRKIVSFIVTILSVALLSFIMFQVLPGDAAVAIKVGEDSVDKVERQAEGVDYHEDPFAHFWPPGE